MKTSATGLVVIRVYHPYVYRSSPLFIATVSDLETVGATAGEAVEKAIDFFDEQAFLNHSAFLRIEMVRDLATSPRYYMKASSCNATAHRNV